MSHRFELKGVDGANPLGFLAALGVFRLTSLRWPDEEVTLAWKRSGHWLPIISGLPIEKAEELCEELLAAPLAPMDELGKLGKNLTVTPEKFKEMLADVDHAVTATDRRAADFAAAFGSEACQDDEGARIRYTLLCFITGSGHQDFLGTIQTLQGCVTAEHLHKALFAEWEDAHKGLSFRWSPSDARSYALRWNNPGPEGAWTTWGANLLAFEALPLFPALPRRRLETTGFRRFGDWPELTWPMWSAELTLDEVRGLMGRSEFQEEMIDGAVLRAVGIEQVFRAARVRIGQGANFKVSFRPARAL